MKKDTDLVHWPECVHVQKHTCTEVYHYIPVASHLELSLKP